MSATVLVIEDEPVLRMVIVDALKANGYRVLEAADAATGERLALTEDVGLVLLDVMLPDRDGFDVLRVLRADRVAAPIVMLTARGEESDRIQGLRGGADDYVVKPFSMEELLLRVSALLQRSGGGVPGVEGLAEVVRFGESEVHFTKFFARCAGRESAMSPRELELMAYFLRFEGQTLDRFRVLSDVWGPEEEPTTRTVDQHVLKLRKKIEVDPKDPRHLITVHGVGYRFSRAPLAPPAPPTSR